MCRWRVQRKCLYSRTISEHVHTWSWEQYRWQHKSVSFSGPAKKMSSIKWNNSQLHEHEHTTHFCGLEQQTWKLNRVTYHCVENPPQIDTWGCTFRRQGKYSIQMTTLQVECSYQTCKRHWMMHQHHVVSFLQNEWPSHDVTIINQIGRCTRRYTNLGSKTNNR